jgi:DeoC/LacD family aldolase
VAKAFAEAHELGMFTVVWCYLRNNAFKKDGVDYSVSADLIGQANHMGVTIEADIIKQKQPENNGGYLALNYGPTSPLVYDQLTTDNPIDLTRWQVANCYVGRIGLIKLGWGIEGIRRPRVRRTYRCDQQTRRRPRAHLGTQIVPAAHGRRCRTPSRSSGRVSRREHHHRLTRREVPGHSDGREPLGVGMFRFFTSRGVPSPTHNICVT